MRRGNEELPLGVIDVETSWIRAGRAPVTRFWGLATERGYQRFETTAALVAGLGTMPRHRLYFHHDFDICQLITDRAVPEHLQVRGVRVVRCQLAGHDLVNSYALFPAPLKAILAACG